MEKQELEIESFNCKYTFWASFITVLIFFPLVIVFIKYLNIQYTVNQTQLIIMMLCLIFGFLIVVMKSTKQKIKFIKSAGKQFISVDKNDLSELSPEISYSIYNYNSRKAFMLRINIDCKSRFYLFSDMTVKSEVEIFFSKYKQKDSFEDFLAKSYSIFLCLAYFIITIVFVLFI